MKPGTPIRVEWLDAGLDTSEAPLDLPDHDSASQDATTIGFFLKLGTENLILAQEHFPHADSYQFRSITRIPRVLLKRVTRLSPGRPASLTARAASTSKRARGKSSSA